MVARIQISAHLPWRKVSPVRDRDPLIGIRLRLTFDGPVTRVRPGNEYGCFVVENELTFVRDHRQYGTSIIVPIPHDGNERDSCGQPASQNLPLLKVRPNLRRKDDVAGQRFPGDAIDRMVRAKPTHWRGTAAPIEARSFALSALADAVRKKKAMPVFRILGRLPDHELSAAS
ncbi:hypothetical protein V1278_001909 [Bradyrhizobium sp. AZCC 1577]